LHRSFPGLSDHSSAWGRRRRDFAEADRDVGHSGRTPKIRSHRCL